MPLAIPRKGGYTLLDMTPNGRKNTRMGRAQPPSEVYGAELRALGSHLRAERNRRRISQEELAARVGVARDTISRIEVGRRDLSMSLLYGIADVLGISAAAFLDGAQAAMGSEPGSTEE